MGYGAIYGQTWWGEGVPNAAGWGNSYAAYIRQNEPNLYLNPELAGGSASGPVAGNNPPTNHTIGFNTGNSQPLPLDGGRFEWDCNYSEEAGVRTYLSLQISDLTLEIGTSYLITYEVQYVSGTSPLLSFGISGTTNLEVEFLNTQASPGGPTTVGAKITPTGPGYAGSTRAGQGITTGSDNRIIVRSPRLVKF